MTITRPEKQVDVQAQRLLIQLAEGGLICPAKLLQSAMAASAMPSAFVLAWLRCLHPQLHFPSLRMPSG